ncbi:DUF7513 family protein [Halodesulfurarchaeum formicicum]|uniref:DUF7513 domain-containing protein n=1 Tax=Halodesulfurarchaeum formicicum TaxID=1873524 RepID=A0A1J1ADN0_9EURY|nr:hypothetical protein [Halodesulfurarchaeum formicicum]APE95831.1 hypothetical protein HSR6_1388 [Halodesulfurarchaeum formicicum]
MSVLEKWLAGWTFRTAKPDYEPGEKIEVMVTSMQNGKAKARIGDSVLRIKEVPEDGLNTRVMVKVDEWDTEDHIGEGTYLETVGESAF